MSEKRSAWEIVQTARDPKRTTAQYMIKYIFDDFMEMHGDKLFADDAAVIGGIEMCIRDRLYPVWGWSGRYGCGVWR